MSKAALLHVDKLVREYQYTQLVAGKDGALQRLCAEQQAAFFPKKEANMPDPLKDTYHAIIAAEVEDLTDWMQENVPPQLAAIVLRTWLFIADNRDSAITETQVRAEVERLLGNEFPNGLPHATIKLRDNTKGS